jgi:DNA-binding beta-propeller fold protein YncE
VQELVNGTPELRRFIGGNEILITRDGRNAYAVASRSNSLVSFQRDVMTGKLMQMQGLLHNTDGVGPLEIVSGLALSPDGKFVYAAAEGNGAVSIFQRR